MVQITDPWLTGFRYEVGVGWGGIFSSRVLESSGFEEGRAKSDKTVYTERTCSSVCALGFPQTCSLMVSFLTESAPRVGEQIAVIRTFPLSWEWGYSRNPSFSLRRFPLSVTLESSPALPAA